jgi:hypothetical protein
MHGIINVDECNSIAKTIYDCNFDPTKMYFVRWFTAMFGLLPNIAVMLWNEMYIHSFLDNKHQFKHILWTMNFLKVYSTIDVMASSTGVSKVTYQKWIKLTIKCIVKIRIVSNVICLFIFLFVIL